MYQFLIIAFLSSLCFFFFKNYIGWKFVDSKSTLNPGDFATDRSKAVVLVFFLFGKSW